MNNVIHCEKRFRKKTVLDCFDDARLRLLQARYDHISAKIKALDKLGDNHEPPKTGV